MSISNYQDISRTWFIISVSSLGLACCLAIILIISRMPLVGAYFDSAIFQSALVLHVNFSLFIWLFAFAAAIWIYFFAFKKIALHWLIIVASLLAISGMLAASLLHESHPVLSNYLPVLDNSLYLGSVILFSAGFAILIVLLLLSGNRSRVGLDEAHFCPHCLLRLMQFMLVCLLMVPLVAWRIDFTGHIFYELLFWGIGHQIQYLFTLLMLWGWIWLAKKNLPDAGHSLAIDDRTLIWFFYLALLPLLLSLFLPLVFTPDSESYRRSFTYLMYTSPLVLPVFIYALYGGRGGFQDQLARTPEVIVLALGLVIMGLVMGILIDGNNLMVPAHYHAVTGAVNLTFMGLGYVMMPKIGFARPSRKWRLRQQRLYAAGVTFLALGLAWSGSLGGVRKMVEHNGDSIQQLLALFTIGVGGLVSLAGCFLFLGLVFSNVRKKPAGFVPLALSKSHLVKGNQDG